MEGRRRLVALGVWSPGFGGVEGGGVVSPSIPISPASKELMSRRRRGMNTRLHTVISDNLSEVVGITRRSGTLLMVEPMLL